MPFHPSPSRVPRADVDPITSADQALALLASVITRPLAHETMGFLLDAAGRGNTVTVVTDTNRADLVVDIAECLAMGATRTPRAASMVLATVRPDSGTLPGDIDPWLEASAIVEQHGLELLEWFVIGPGGPECPRDLLGEPERWPEDSPD